MFYSLKSELGSRLISNVYDVVYLMPPALLRCGEYIMFV